jgi:hypothetical protein
MYDSVVLWGDKPLGAQHFNKAILEMGGIP